MPVLAISPPHPRCGLYELATPEAGGRLEWMSEVKAEVQPFGAQVPRAASLVRALHDVQTHTGVGLTRAFYDGSFRSEVTIFLPVAG